MSFSYNMHTEITTKNKSITTTTTTTTTTWYAKIHFYGVSITPDIVLRTLQDNLTKQNTFQPFLDTLLDVSIYLHTTTLHPEVKQLQTTLTSMPITLVNTMAYHIKHAYFYQTHTTDVWRVIQN